MSKLVSIGFPVYNGIKHNFEVSLQAILNQDYPDLEILVSDNGSTDGTFEILQDYEKKDPRIHLFQMPQNLGADMNFFRCLYLSRGEYFKWVADDDYHKPDYIRRCVEVLENENETVLCHTRSLEGTLEENHEIRDQYEVLADSPRERYREFLQKVTDGNAFYGLWRSKILFSMIPREFENTSPAIYFLTQAVMFGKIRQIPDFLRIMGRDFKWNLDSEEGYKYLYQIMDTRRKRTGLTCPATKLFSGLVNLIRFSDWNLQEKEEGLEFALQEGWKRFEQPIAMEMRRLIRFSLKKMTEVQWGEESPVTVSGKYEKFLASDILKKMEDFQQLLPEFYLENFFMVRGVFYALQGRLEEAKGAIESELRLFPENQMARTIYPQIFRACEGVRGS